MSEQNTVVLGEKVEGKSVSEAVVTAIADLEGKDPIDLSPLYEAVEPDALDQLGHKNSSVTRIEFTYCGHEVVIESDGQIEIDGSVQK